MDKSVALRLGHPSVLNDDDIGIDLPLDEIVQKRPDGSTKYAIFRCQTQLARLESRIHTELYSARALRKSTMDRLRMVGELDKTLMEWKEALPVEIQPERDIQGDEGYILPIVMMHFAYFNCLTTIHRVSIHHGSWTSSHLSQSGATLHDQHLNPRVYASQSICLAAARQSIQLLRFVDIKAHTTSNSVIWFVNPFNFIFSVTMNPVPFVYRLSTHFIAFFLIDEFRTNSILGCSCTILSPAS